MMPFMIACSLFEIRNSWNTIGNVIMSNKLLVLEAGFALLIMQIFYLLSGEYTVMSHATLFTNTTPFFLVIFRLIKR